MDRPLATWEQARPPGSRPEPVSWGTWGHDGADAALIRHAPDEPVPPPPCPPVSELRRTGWWRCVPVRGKAYDTAWQHAIGPGRGAFHATLYVG